MSTAVVMVCRLFLFFDLIILNYSLFSNYRLTVRTLGFHPKGKGSIPFNLIAFSR